ncbi:MAG TPA: GldM family protein [Chitinophagaceae bacterium]|nr:GldM family protein [Chitinophagaceae bacterium]
MRSIFFFISFFIPIFLFSQFNIISLKLTDTTKNIFYIGYDNPIRVSGKGISGNYQVEISGAAGSLYKDKENFNQYFVRVVAPGMCSITIKQNGKKVFYEEFNAEILADPVATLSGIRDTTVSRNRILLNPFLSVVIPNCFYQHNIRISSFRATFINAGDSIPTIAGGNLLSQEQLGLVKEAEPGSKINFEDIRGNGPDGRTRKLPPFWIKIK